MLSKGSKPSKKSGNTKRRLARTAPRRSLKELFPFSGTGAITQLRNPGLIRSAKMSGATIRMKNRAKPKAEGRALSCCLVIGKEGALLNRGIGIDQTFDVPFDRYLNKRHTSISTQLIEVLYAGLKTSFEDGGSFRLSGGLRDLKDL